ncbi:unnamed protein product [Dicrocoelium dendriticum]|nr:unnamed protein product [Dicrocoelium dendriticum]
MAQRARCCVNAYNRRTPDGVRGVLCVLGCCLIHLGYGYFYTIGNMGTYITAYMSHRDVTVTKNDMLLLTAVLIGFESLAMPIGGLVHKKIGLRPLVLVSALIQVAAIMVTYFTVKTIFIAVLITYGILQGIGLGSGYSVLVSVAAQWFPTRKSLVVGLVLGSFAAGGFVFTPIQTAYINPSNVKPDNRTGLFLDTELIGRIPKAFLISGAAVALVHTVGFILLAEKTDPVLEIDAPTEITLVDQHELQEVKKPSHCLPNVSPLHALRTLDFYLLWICMCATMIPTTSVSSLSKFFGLEHIRDDQFLAGVAMASSVFNAVGRVFWGLVGDYTSFKAPLCGLFALWSALMFSFPHLSTLDANALKVAYAFWICCMFFCISGNLVFVPTGCSTLFGNKHWAVNFGAIFTACIIGSAISAGLSFLPAKPNGLMYQFTIGGVSCSIGLLSSLWLRDSNLAKPLRSLDCFLRIRDRLC